MCLSHYQMWLLHRKRASGGWDSEYSSEMTPDRNYVALVEDGMNPASLQEVDWIVFRILSNIAIVLDQTVVLLVERTIHWYREDIAPSTAT